MSDLVSELQQYSVLHSRPNIISYDTSGQVTVLEMITRTGKANKPLFIYKEVP